MDDKEQILEEILKVGDTNNKQQSIIDNVNWLFNVTDDYRPYPLVASKTNSIIDYMRSEYPFSFISAFRRRDKKGDIITKKVNMNNTRKLAVDLRSNNLAFINILGEWDETLKDKETGKIYNDHVKEITFFVVGSKYNNTNKEDINNFRKLMVSLQLKYRQNSVIIGYIDTKGARPLKTTNTDMLNDPKNKDIDFSHDIYCIEFIADNGNIKDIKNKYNILSKEDVEKLKIRQFEIDNINEAKLRKDYVDDIYVGHTKIDNKNFVFSKCYEYHPNSMMITAGFRRRKYLDTIGLYF
jgi:hypothetical protein